MPPDLSQPDSPTVTVGQEDTVIKAWYIARGDGPPGAGVLIDAFDVNQGTFVDDDFVTVAPDSTLTAAANADGFVPTTAPEIVSASHLIEYVPFYDWTIVAGTETINHEDLQTAAQSSAIAFAFYWAPHGLGLRPPRRYEVGIRIYAGVTNDGPGLTDHGPVGPWYPFVAQFAAGLALADAASLVSPELKANVLDIAARQVSVAAGAIMQQMQIGTKKAG